MLVTLQYSHVSALITAVASGDERNEQNDGSSGSIEGDEVGNTHLQLAPALNEVFASGQAHLVCDLRSIESLSVVDFAALLVASQASREQGGTVTVVSDSRSVRALRTGFRDLPLQIVGSGADPVD